MRNGSVILGSLFILVALVIFFGGVSRVPFDQSSLFGFTVIDAADHARQVRDALKVGIAAGLGLAGILVMAFLWERTPKQD